MSIRNLDRLLRPRAVALIGASPRPRSVGNVVARNLKQGGFTGRIMLVNPRHDSIDGEPCFPTIAALPEVPDLGVVAAPQQAVPGIVADLAARGSRAAVVITAGFGEDKGTAGKALQQAMLDAARPHLLRIVGPNCLGIINTRIGLNASFAHMAPQAGSLAFVAQSGAVIASMIDWATPRGIGFSHLLSLGDMADVDFGDMLDYLVQDAETRSILLYVEMITHPRKFMSAARAAARVKPVIVVKAGRHAEGARAAASHTGALAGADMVYDAAFRRAGMLRVFETAELFAAAETLALAPRISGDRLAILTNGGGMGVMATDRLIDEGGRLAELSAATMAALDAVLPATWSHGNPIDIIGDADGPRYAAALTAVMAAPEVDAVLVLNCPTAVASSSEAADAVAGVAGNRPQPAVLTSWVGSAAAAEARTILSAHRMPTYDTPEEATRAFMHMVRYRANQRALMECPPSAVADPPRREDVGRLIEETLRSGGEWLPLPAVLDVLAAYGVPTVATRVARTAAEAAAAAADLAPPYALKILSPDIQHKSDVGGVALDLARPADVGAATVHMLENIARRHPAARLDGVMVQSMVRRPRAHELLLGIADDRQFGPVILFGHGGTATEVIADRAVALPPLNAVLARDLMRRTKVYRLLQGYRDRPAADLDAIAAALGGLARLAADHPAIVELDINPLLTDETGVLALDGRIRVSREAANGPSRMAIRPYPSELEGTVTLRSGHRIAIRPVRPEDAADLGGMFARCRPEDLYLRFFSGLRQVPDAMAARLSQIDYEREMALVAFAADPAAPGLGPGMLGIVHLIASPDLDSAEFAVIVRSDVKGQGLGYCLMNNIIRYAEQRGVQAIYGHVLRVNEAMTRMSHELGFVTAESEDGDLIRVQRPVTGGLADPLP